MLTQETKERFYEILDEVFLESCRCRSEGKPAGIIYIPQADYNVCRHVCRETADEREKALDLLGCRLKTAGGGSQD